MRLSKLLGPVELGDIRTARIRAWARLVYASLGALIGGAMYYLIHPERSFEWQKLLISLMLIAFGVTAGTAYDVWRVLRPEATARSIRGRLIFLVIVASAILGFLLFWVLVQ